MGVMITINLSSGLPVYRQIVDQVKCAIGAGRLKPGDKLPTHRDLAAELVVAPMTVKKAYDTLVGEKLIIMGAGRGTFVASDARPMSRADKRERIAEAVRQLALESSAFDLPVGEAVQMLEKEYGNIKARKGD